jgi:hypothetical protein
VRQLDHCGKNLDQPFGVKPSVPGDPTSDGEALQKRPVDGLCQRLAAIAPEHNIDRHGGVEPHARERYG